MADIYTSIYKRHKIHEYTTRIHSIALRFSCPLETSSFLDWPCSFYPFTIVDLGYSCPISSIFLLYLILYQLQKSQEAQASQTQVPGDHQASAEAWNRGAHHWGAQVFWKSRWFPQWCSRDVLIISNPEIPSLLVLLGYSGMLRCILMRTPFQREAMWVSSRTCAMERGWRAALFRNSLQEPLYMKAKPPISWKFFSSFHRCSNVFGVFVNFLVHLGSTGLKWFKDVRSVQSWTLNQMFLAVSGLLCKSRRDATQSWSQIQVNMPHCSRSMSIDV